MRPRGERDRGRGVVEMLAGDCWQVDGQISGVNMLDASCDEPRRVTADDHPRAGRGRGGRHIGVHAEERRGQTSGLSSLTGA